MKENRKQKDIFVKIPDDFRKQELTLEQAYIKGRVSRFNDGGLLYYESNKTLSKIMGKRINGKTCYRWTCKRRSFIQKVTTKKAPIIYQTF